MSFWYKNYQYDTVKLHPTFDGLKEIQKVAEHKLTALYSLSKATLIFLLSLLSLSISKKILFVEGGEEEEKSTGFLKKTVWMFLKVNQDGNTMFTVSKHTTYFTITHCQFNHTLVVKTNHNTILY